VCVCSGNTYMGVYMCRKHPHRRVYVQGTLTWVCICAGNTYMGVYMCMKYLGLARTVYIHPIQLYIWYLVIFLPKIPYVHRIHMVLANPAYICTVYDHINGKIPAKNTVGTPYTYGSGQP